MEDFLYNDLKSKRILIIGSASGHGAFFAKKFFEIGATPILVDIDNDIDNFAKSISQELKGYSLDVRDPNVFKVLAKEIDGPLHGIIYNPRARIRKAFLEIESRDLDTEYQIGLRGACLASQALLSHLAKQSEEHPFIILISSVLSHSIGNENVGYHTSKAGIDHLTRYLAVELGKYKIRVNAVAPGWVVKQEHEKLFESQGNEKYRKLVEDSHAINQRGNSQDIFEAIAFLSSKRSRFITGQIINVDGGVNLKEPSHFLLSTLQDWKII